MKTILQRYLTLLLVFVVVFSACKKKDDGEDGKKDPALTTQKSDVYPYEIMVVDAENMTLSAQSYKGKIGTTEVAIAADEEHLVFVVPELPAGSHTLSVNLDGKDYELALAIKQAAAIPDASQYVQEKVAAIEYNDEELMMMVSVLSGKPGGEQINEQAASLKEIFAEVKNAMATASQEEKEITAKFIAANPELFTKNSFVIDTSAMLKSSSTKDLEQIVKDLDLSIKKQVAVVLAGGLATALIVDYLPGKFKLLGLVTGGATAALIYYTNSEMIDAIANKALERFNDIIVKELSQKKSTSGDLFTNGKAYTISFASDYRNLNSQSANNGSLVITSIYKTLNKFTAYWNRTVGKFPKRLVGEPFHIKNIKTIKTRNFVINPAYLSIKNVTNNVTATVDKSNGSLNVTFRANGTTDQAFTYDVVYECAGFTTYTQKMQGTVSFEDDSKSLIKSSGINGVVYDYSYNSEGILTRAMKDGIYTIDLVWSAGHLGINDNYWGPASGVRNGKGYVISSGNETYTYDAQNRLVKSEYNSSYQATTNFTWANGNLISYVMNDNKGKTETWTFEYDASKKQKADMGTKYWPSFEERGWKPVMSFVFFHSKNVLTRITKKADNKTESTDYTYKYDSKGRIIEGVAVGSTMPFTFTYFD